MASISCLVSWTATIGIETAIFKMMIETAVVQIDRAAGGYHVIHHAHLGMTEARRIFIDTDTVLCQAMIVRPRHGIDNTFVRDRRCDDAHIHAPLFARRMACTISSVRMR